MGCKRILTGLFICLFSFLLMSHNAGALELTQDVDSVYSWKNPQIWCMVFQGSLYSNGSDTCIVGTNTGTAWQGRGVSYIKTANINLVAGDFYQVYLDVAVSSGAQKQIPVMWNLGTTANYDIVSFRMVSQSNNMGTTADNEIYVTTYEIILKGLYNNPSFPIELGYADGSINMIYLGGDFYTDTMDVRVSRVNQYHPRAAQSNQDVVNAIENMASDIVDTESQATQDAADGSQSSGDQAAADSEQATSSLLNTITGFFNAIINTNPTNCKFDSHLPFLSGNGEIDLCSINTPPIVQTLSSLVLVGLFIPFAIHMFNRFISITESFQR